MQFSLISLYLAVVDLLGGLIVEIELLAPGSVYVLHGIEIEDHDDSDSDPDSESDSDSDLDFDWDADLDLAWPPIPVLAITMKFLFSLP